MTFFSLFASWIDNPVNYNVTAKPNQTFGLITNKVCSTEIAMKTIEANQKAEGDKKIKLYHEWTVKETHKMYFTEL